MPSSRRPWFRVLRLALYGFGGLILLIVLVHLVENWRGKRAWESWKAQREALGDRYELPIPPAVPEADNFAAVPLVARACVKTEQAKPLLGDFQLPSELPDRGSWREGQRENLEAWAQAMKAPDIPRALAPVASELTTLAEASRRPACRMPVHYEAGDVPGYKGFRTAGRALRLQALASLAANQAEAAREDVLTLLRMGRHVGGDGLFISALLQMALADMAMQPIWEGLVDHRWREGDLVALQEELGKLDLLQTLARAWHAERMTFSTDGPGSLRRIAELPSWDRAKELDQALQLYSMAQKPASRLRTLAYWAFVPKGWIYQNLVHLDRIWVKQFEPRLDARNHRFQSEPIGQFDVEAFVGSGRNPYRILAIVSIPALLGQNQKGAARQVGVDQAQVACALERFRLAKKAYPESLAELVSAGLIQAVPVDVPAGEALRYRRTGNGYVLYSLGLDKKDEGGRVVLEAPAARQDLKQGDWAWVVPGAAR